MQETPSSRLSRRPTSRPAALATAAVLILALAAAVAAGAQDPAAAEQTIARLRTAVAGDPDNVELRFQLASVLAAMGRFEEAGPVFAAVVERDPTNSAARRGEVTALLLQSRYLEVRQKLEEGLRTLPQDGQLAHTLARLLATAPLDKVRDGDTALALALKVWEVKKIYETGETVAMAMAEAGRFEDAVEFQRGLVEQAEAAAEEKHLDGLRRRLLSYLGGKPWRAESPMEIAMATEPPRPAPPP